jgi:hypothetical protein
MLIRSLRCMSRLPLSTLLTLTLMRMSCRGLTHHSLVLPFLRMMLARNPLFYLLVGCCLFRRCLRSIYSARPELPR